MIPQRPAGFLREEFIQCFRGSQIVHALEAEFTDLIRDSDQRVPMRHILPGIGVQPQETFASFM